MLKNTHTSDEEIEMVFRQAVTDAVIHEVKGSSHVFSNITEQEWPHIAMRAIYSLRASGYEISRKTNENG